MDGSRGSSGSSGTALSSGFVEDDSPSGRDIEGTDTAGHGNAQKVIAGAPDEIVQASALAAKNDDEIAGEVELVVVGGATLVEADDPEIALLKLFKGADDVDDACDAEMLGCTGAGFESNGTKRRGAALSENDTVDTGTVGDTKQRAEILRIFDTVEGEDEPGGA